VVMVKQMHDTVKAVVYLTNEEVEKLGKELPELSHDELYFLFELAIETRSINHFSLETSAKVKKRLELTEEQRKKALIELFKPRI
jgi:hypothetical protein